MARLEETDRTIDLITNSYPVKTQEYLMLKEIARSVAVIADSKNNTLKPFFSAVHNDESSIYPHNFTIDWEAGNDAAKEDISDFAHKQIEKYSGKLQDTWDAGYFAGMMDIIEFIERMGTDEGN